MGPARRPFATQCTLAARQRPRRIRDRAERSHRRYSAAGIGVGALEPSRATSTGAGADARRFSARGRRFVIYSGEERIAFPLPRRLRRLDMFAFVQALQAPPASRFVIIFGRDATIRFQGEHVAAKALAIPANGATACFDPSAASPPSSVIATQFQARIAVGPRQL